MKKKKKKEKKKLKIKVKKKLINKKQTGTTFKTSDEKVQIKKVNKQPTEKKIYKVKDYL